MLLPKMKIGQMNNDHLSRHMIRRDNGRHKGMEQSIAFSSTNKFRRFNTAEVSHPNISPVKGNETAV